MLAVVGAIAVALVVGFVVPAARALPIIVMLTTVFLVLPQGVVGDSAWPAIVAEDGPIWLSSPGGHLLVAAFLASSVGLVGYQIAGLVLLGIAAYVITARVPSLQGDGLAPVVARVAVAVGVAAFPLAALYRSVHWETTTFAPALALLGTALILAGVISVRGRPGMAETLTGLMLVGVASGVHPAAVVVVPGALVIAIAGLWRSQAIGRLAAVLTAAGAVVVGIGLVLLAAVAVGRGVTPGDAQGGGDGAMLAADLFGSAHWEMWALAMAVAGAGGLCVAVAGIAGAVRPRRSGDQDPPGLVPAMVAMVIMSALGTWLWGFDLGFPTDADLMAVFGMGIPIAALLAVVALSRRSVEAWLAMLAMSVALVIGAWGAFALAPLPA